MTQVEFPPPRIETQRGVEDVTGVTTDGEAVEHSRRDRRHKVPRGPLSREQVQSYQATIALGLKRELGLSDSQIGQILGRSKLTVSRRRNAFDPAPMQGRV